MTREEFIKKYKNDCRYYFDGYYSDCIDDFLTNIYNDHEAQLKAKDKRIAELEKNNTNLINDVIVLDNDLHRFLSIERKKTRSIVAMLFWEWRKDKRIYENANKYTKETAELYVNCSELSFKKAYAMLKGK